MKIKEKNYSGVDTQQTVWAVRSWWAHWSRFTDTAAAAYFVGVNVDFSVSFRTHRSEQWC